MIVRLLAAADRRPSPWKNGAGVTRQIAAYPDGARTDEFDWRASMAVVKSAGPFSAFPGIERSLLVLEGELALVFADGRRLVLDAAGPAANFAGEDAVSAEAPAVPVTDLNVMVRRGAHTASVERRQVAAAATVVCQDVTLILCRAGGLRAACGGTALELGPNDALRIDGARGAAARLRCDLFTDIVIVHINAVRRRGDIADPP
jgi:hypothetical protein